MLPVLPVALPLLTAALLAALTKVIPQRLSQLVALASTLGTLAADLVLLRLSASRPIVYWLGGWKPHNGLALGISFTIEPIGAGLAALASFLTLAAIVFSSEYFDTAENHFHTLTLTFLAAMGGFALTGDMFNMFVFFELMSAAAFALCGYKTDDPGSLQGAFNFAVTNTVAAYFVLTGLGLLNARTGALNMAQMGLALNLHRPDSLVLVAFVFLVCGYLVKAAVVPFHFWLADAQAAAPTPVCLLFSGVMIPMGLFALAKIYWSTFSQPFHSHTGALTTIFVSLGIITAFTGAFMSYVQSNLKRLLAFSTVSHAGLILLGLGLFTAEGLAGAALYTVGYAMSISALFLIAGILLHRFEAIEIPDLHGKARPAKWTAALYLAAALASLGFPGSSLASGHDLTIASAKLLGLGWLKWIFLFAEALTGAAALRAGAQIFLGWGPVDSEKSAPKHEEKPDTEQGHANIPASMFLTAAALAAAGLLGLTPGFEEATLTASASFEDTKAFLSRVMYGTYFSTPFHAHSAPPGIALALLTTFAAVTIALLHLFSPRLREVSATLSKPLILLHRIHSGHIGDYIAFLTFGMACLGLIFAFAFR